MTTVYRFLQPLIGDIAAIVTIILAWRTCADVNTASGRFVLVLLTALVMVLIVFSTSQEYRYARRRAIRR